MPEPYYAKAEGLRFECTRCGLCCTRPGPVFFPPADLARAARFLMLTPGEFKRKFRLHRLDGVLALEPDDRDACPFHEDGRGCSIYDARPTQCRTFPFWPEIAHRRRSWESAGRACEGIGRGPRQPPTAIERAIVACREAGLPRSEPW